MGKQFSLSLLILCVVLSLEIAVSSEKNYETASVQHILEKRASPYKTPSSEVPQLVAHDRVEVRRGDERLGDAFVISLHYAVVHASIFNDTSVVGLRAVWYLPMSTILAGHDINHIGHPIGQDIRYCTPNVALIRTSGVLPTDRRAANQIFKLTFTPSAIEWAAREVSRALRSN